jgi:hypothetical protein
LLFRRPWQTEDESSTPRAGLNTEMVMIQIVMKCTYLRLASSMSLESGLDQTEIEVMAVVGFG